MSFLTAEEIAQTIEEEKATACMIDFSNDENGVAEALVEGIDDRNFAEIKQALHDCIEQRNDSPEALKRCHTVLGRLIAESAINFLSPEE